MARDLIKYMLIHNHPRAVIAETIRGLRARYSHKFLNTDERENYQPKA